MDSNYIYIKTNLLIRRFERNASESVLSVLDGANKATATKPQSTFKINDSAIQIISLFDGTMRFEEIVVAFARANSISEQDSRAILLSFKSSLEFEYGFVFSGQDTPITHSAEYVGFENMYPSQITLEVTSRCNHRCRHCYGRYGEGVDIPISKVPLVFESMSELGIPSVEISGGEPSVHPEIAEIVNLAFDSGISAMSFLTNGYDLSEALIGALIKHRDKITMQVDLHSLDEDYYDWFTGAKNTLKRVQRNILTLIDNDIRVSLACVVTPKNIHEVSSIAKWAASNDVFRFRPSPVVNLGRVSDADAPEDLLLTSEKDVIAYYEMAKEIESLFPDMVRKAPTQKDLEITNCGVTVSHCIIGPLGDIKFCGMQSENDFHFAMGNVFTESLASIYDRKKELVDAFMKTPAPREWKAPCSNCEHRLFCANCLFRGFIMAKKTNGECAWYQENIPNLLKKELSLLS